VTVCVSEPPTRWNPTGLYPCRHLDSPDRAGRLRPRALRSRERIVGIPTPRGQHHFANSPTSTFRAHSWRPRPRKATPHRRRYNSRPSRRCSAGAICAASHKPAPARTAAFALPILQRLAAVRQRHRRAVGTKAVGPIWSPAPSSGPARGRGRFAAPLVAERRRGAGGLAARRRGLAGAGLCDAAQIAPAEHRRDGLELYRRRCVSLPRRGRQEWARKVQGRRNWAKW